MYKKSVLTDRQCKSKKFYKKTNGKVVNTHPVQAERENSAVTSALCSSLCVSSLSGCRPEARAEY